MITQLTLEEVTDRLLSLEERVALLSTKLKPSEKSLTDHSFEYVILVNGQEVWSGLELEEQYLEICKRYPKADVMISWRLLPSLTLI